MCKGYPSSRVNQDVNVKDKSVHGIDFKFDAGSDAKSRKIRLATQGMVSRIANELFTFFGFSVDIEEIWEAGTVGGCISQLPGMPPPATNFVGYRLVSTNDTEKKAAAERSWQFIINQIERLFSDFDEFHIRINLIDKMRNFVRRSIETRNTIVEMQTDGSVALGGMAAIDRGTKMTCNPFTWFVINGNTWINPQQFSDIRVGRFTARFRKTQLERTWGPTLLLIHEMEHLVGTTIEGKLLPGTGTAIYEEDDVMVDVDAFASAHPYLAIRGQYGVGYGMYTITGEKLPDDYKGCKVCKDQPTDKEWIKWPNEAELSTGRR